MLDSAMTQIRKALHEAPAAMALVTEPNRIRGAFDREADEAARRGCVVVVQLRGGPSRASAPVVAAGAAVWCYSARSSAEAARLYDATRATLQLLDTRTTSALGAYTGGLYLRERESGTIGWSQDHAAWYVGSLWTVHMFGG